MEVHHCLHSLRNMAAYFTRSTPRPGGYYRELHRITADFDGAAVRRNA